MTIFPAAFPLISKTFEINFENVALVAVRHMEISQAITQSFHGGLSWDRDGYLSLMRNCHGRTEEKRRPRNEPIKRQRLPKPPGIHPRSGTERAARHAADPAF